MKYILDTNIISYYLKYEVNDFTLWRNIEKCELDDLKTTTISVSELYYGIYKNSMQRTRIFRSIEKFIDLIGVLEFDLKSSIVFGKLKGMMSSNGITIADMDLMIASITVSNDSTLVTHNMKHFSKVRGLNLVDWTLT